MLHFLQWFLLVLAIQRLALAESLQEAGCVVQLSDLHLSEYNASQFKRFGDRLGDLRLLSSTVLRAINPQAVLLTGDLVDGKSRSGSGRQSVAEWQDYRSFLETLKGEVGLQEAELLDLRGNHDTFNTVRLGNKDYFAIYAAAGRRNSSARTYSKEVMTTARTACPAVATLGVDLSQDPGLAGINFFGRAPASLTAEIEHELQTLLANLQRKGCSQVPLLAYGHYPLSVVTQAFKLPREAERSATSSLRDLFLKYNVSAYVAGHLHAAFGRKLHRLHGQRGRFMAELETSAWLNDRRFRLMCFQSGSMAFSDLYFYTETTPRQEAKRAFEESSLTERPFLIGAEATTQKVNDYIILIISPPSRRYNPLLGRSLPAGKASHSVTALILPVSHDVSSKPGKAVVELMKTDTQQHTPVASASSSSDRRGRPDSCRLSCYWPVKTSLARGLGGLSCLTSMHTSGHLLTLSNIARRMLCTYRTMYCTYGLWFFGMLLLPALGDKLGWRARMQEFTKKAPLPLKWLTYPGLILLDQAAMKDVFLPQLVYSGSLFIVPWGVGRFLEGEPLGLFWLGRIMFYKNGRRVWWQSADTSITTVMAMTSYILPMTMLCASIVSRCFDKQQRRRSVWTFLSVPQLTLMLGVHWLGFRTLYRFGYGPLGQLGFFLSPGMAGAVAFYLVLTSWLFWKAWVEYRGVPVQVEVSQEAKSE